VEKIPGLLAGTKNRQGRPGQGQGDEFRDDPGIRAVRHLPFAVDVEKTEGNADRTAGNGQRGLVFAPAVGRKLARRRRGVVFPNGQPGFIAVFRRRTGQHEPPQPQGFGLGQQAQARVPVDLHGLRLVRHRMRHADDGRQMEHDFETGVGASQPGEQLRIGDARLVEGEAGVVGEGGQIGRQTGKKIVHPDHRAPQPQQRLGQMAPDKSGHPRNEAGSARRGFALHGFVCPSVFTRTDYCLVILTLRFFL